MAYIKIYNTLFEISFFGLDSKQKNEIELSFPVRELSEKPEVKLRFLNADSSSIFRNKAKRLIKDNNLNVSRYKNFFRKKPDFVVCDAKKSSYYFSLKRPGELSNSVLLALEGCIFRNPDKYKVIFLHAAGVCMKSKGIIFLAPSGGGKTTIAKLARNSGYQVFSDELLLIKQKKENFYFFSYPLSHKVGKSGSVLFDQECCKVGSIYFLKKGESVGIKKLSFINSLGKGFAQATFFINSLPPAERKENRKYILSFLTRLFRQVAPQELSFPKEGKVFTLL